MISYDHIIFSGCHLLIWDTINMLKNIDPAPHTSESSYRARKIIAVAAITIDKPVPTLTKSLV